MIAAASVIGAAAHRWGSPTLANPSMSEPIKLMRSISRTPKRTFDLIGGGTVAVARMKPSTGWLLPAVQV